MTRLSFVPFSCMTLLACAPDGPNTQLAGRTVTIDIYSEGIGETAVRIVNMDFGQGESGAANSCPQIEDAQWRGKTVTAYQAGSWQTDKFTLVTSACDGPHFILKEPMSVGGDGLFEVDDGFAAIRIQVATEVTATVSMVAPEERVESDTPVEFRVDVDDADPMGWSSLVVVEEAGREEAVRIVREETDGDLRRVWFENSHRADVRVRLVVPVLVRPPSPQCVGVKACQQELTLRIRSEPFAVASSR